MESNKRKILPYLGLVGLLMVLQSLSASHTHKTTHKLLMGVNKNWKGINIVHSYTPQSEKGLVQLHLLNVVEYLKNQDIPKLSTEQRKNRHQNIAILQEYALKGEFPLNTTNSNRTPIFIDANNIHCAVGYLMKENSLGTMAQEIAKKQRIAYLGDIQHPQLIPWQKSSGLSLFELALIQPTYGPSTPICTSPSAIKWQKINTTKTNVKQIFTHKKNMYGITRVGEYGLKDQIRKYVESTDLWSPIGSTIDGEVLDLIFLNNEIYISVLLPMEDFPHQLLKLKGNAWKKVAHFNGSIKSIQVFNHQLFINGYFTMVNDLVKANFIILNNDKIRPFKPVGLRTSSFDQMVASTTALFLTSNSGIFKYKNDSITYLSSIQYYQYIKQTTLDAQYDSLYICSRNLPGYQRYIKGVPRSFHLGNMLTGPENNNVNFTKCKRINGHMIIAGDFRTTTFIPRINNNTHLMQCADSMSSHWFGEGLLYEFGHKYYPMLKAGIVLDFVQVENRLYILQKDGSIHYTYLSQINQKISQFHKGSF